MKKYLLPPVLIVFVFLVGLLADLTGLSKGFWEIQQKEESSMLESKFTIFQAQGASGPPPIAENLCSNQGEQKLVTKEGQLHTFRNSAESVRRCEAGEIWEVVEDGSKVPDTATFYFDGNGVFLDICQRLFWRSGCKRFGNVSCEQRNYCK